MSDDPKRHHFRRYKDDKRTTNPRSSLKFFMLMRLKKNETGKVKRAKVILVRR